MDASTQTYDAPTPDPDALEALLGQMVTELGAAMVGTQVILGDALGLYEALARIGPASADALAEATDTHPRYVREWLAAQAASGYVTHTTEAPDDPEADRFFMTPEQQAVLADPDSPTNMTGGFIGLQAMYTDIPKIRYAFASGEGVGWGDHCSCLFTGTEKFFRPTYRAHLVDDWLASIPGLTETLTQGARVADVGCGLGASTEIMSDAFPASSFIGFDLHEESIERAREKVTDDRPNLTFEVDAATTYPGQYDLVAFFDCLHDMGDPVGALRHTREHLRPGGDVMVVEPIAGTSLRDNLNPVGRVYYAASTMLCVPSAMSQDGPAALGAQAGQDRLTDVAEKAGFSSVTRVAETPFNMILHLTA